MTPSAEEMMSRREAIKELGGFDWDKKVDKMSDDQVTAIYLKSKRDGKL